MSKSRARTAQRQSCRLSPFDVVASSHVGLIRECNEDSYVYWVDEHSASAMVAIADGIGDHESGDVASSLCMRQLLVSWRGEQMPEVAAPAKLSDFLLDAIGQANTEIFSLNREFQIQHPMGTTIVAGIFTATHLVVAHVGDSRCYRLRHGVLKRLTQDHSFVAELIRKRIINPIEARNHPFAHIISRSVGPTSLLEAELNVFERQPHDRYVFCSDGLCAHVEDPEIETIVYDATNPYEAAKNLLYAALRGGGEDNITVICVFG